MVVKKFVAKIVLGCVIYKWHKIDEWSCLGYVHKVRDGDQTLANNSTPCRYSKIIADSPIICGQIQGKFSIIILYLGK